jgi:hydrogenase maturation factor HypF (carbamoyltransferase family)
MCTAVINLTSKALSNIENAEALIKIKTIIALFIQTMEVRQTILMLGEHPQFVTALLTYSGLGLSSNNAG